MRFPVREHSAKFLDYEGTQQKLAELVRSQIKSSQSRSQMISSSFVSG